MDPEIEGWTKLADEPPVFVREYSFGQGAANAMAVRLPDGTFLLVSAPTQLSAAESRAFAARGGVTALLACNGAHHLGLGPCQGSFPNAVTYAHGPARQRILQKSSAPGQLESLEQLRPRLGDKIQVIAADGCKIGDVIVRVQTERGALLYVSDFIANISELPKNLLFKLMFWLTDSGPGFKVFGIFFRFFVSDKAALREFLIREIEAHPPAIVVPGHGEVVTQPQLAPTLVSMLRAAV